MGLVDMSSKPPPAFQTKDFFSSPALSLSLAGIFRDGAAGNVEEKGGEGSSGGGGSGKEVETVEISSENSGPLRSRTISEEEIEEEGGEDENEPNNINNKKRKKYHRHTSDQIREMEALFKESPHPDEKQREQLSKQLGLHPRQVKFWFQNRRTQIKAVQERHENTLLKMELEKLRDENKSLRETIPQASSCLHCGYTDFTKHASISKDEQQLRIENARLKLEIEKLRTAIGKYTPGASPTSSSGCAENNIQTKSSLDLYSGMFGIEKSRIMEVVNQALQELNQMANSREPLWIRSFETGREILNYDEYIKQFPAQISENGKPKRSIEASRDTGIVFIDLPRLVQIFVDVNQWKEIFPCLISKAATVDVILPGEGANRDGLIQLMFAELQMLTPMVPTREVYFVRYSKQLSVDKWAIVDVSIDQLEDTIDASLTKCRKRPSGCIIEDKSNGHSQVTWLEHLECQKSTMMVNSLYRATVNSGLAFGAKHWMTTLMMQCERLVFFMATNVPTKDSSGVATIAGRKSIFRLAQRMTVGFCRALGASSYNTWSKVAGKSGDDIRVASRKNLNDPGEPLGTILCAVSSTWLQVSQHVLFEFLRDASNRNTWDIMSNGGPVQPIVNLAKGQDRGNAVSIQTMQSKDKNLWVLQDSCTNAYESMIVYAPVDVNGMQSVMTGCDSSNISVLPSGFSILPDGMESRSMVITSKPEEKNTDGGSLLTIAFQILTSDSLTAKLTVETIESVNTLISSTLQKIKSSLNYEEG